MFLEIADAEVSPHLVHAHIYTWNEQFARDLIANYGFGLRASAPILRALARRLIVAQIFLHSDHSARIELRLAADGRLIAAPRDNPATDTVLNRTKSRLARIMANARQSTLGFATRQGSPRQQLSRRRQPANGQITRPQPIRPPRPPAGP